MYSYMAYWIGVGNSIMLGRIAYHSAGQGSIDEKRTKCRNSPIVQKI